MPSFPYMSQVYNSIPNAFREMTPMYADAPRLRYEKQKAEEQQAYNRALDAKKMGMAEQEFAAQQTARHLDNAVKLLKLGGAGAATGYLDKFTPGHGITVEGIGGGMYVAKGKGGRGGSGGSGAVGGTGGVLVDANSGWVTQLDKNGRVVTTNGIIMMMGPKGQRVPLKMGTPAADKWFADNKVAPPIIGMESSNAGKQYERRRVYNKDTQQVEEMDFDRATGLPAVFDPASLGGVGGDEKEDVTTGVERPLPAGSPPGYRGGTEAPPPPAGRSLGDPGTPARFAPAAPAAVPPPAASPAPVVAPPPAPLQPSAFSTATPVVSDAMEGFLQFGGYNAKSELPDIENRRDIDRKRREKGLPPKFGY